MESSNQNCRKTVLVVDDEPLLRMLAVDTALDAGFEALEAGGSAEALAILEGRSDICLLFTDVQMPGGMDGIQLASTVHTRWPDIAIIVTSGRVRPTNELPPETLFLPKPYNLEALLPTFEAARHP